MKKKTISLAPAEILKLKTLYDKGDEFTYNDLTPNLQAYADWVFENEGLIRELARTKFAYWGGWNALMTALNYVDKKMDKSPRLAFNSKFEVDENDFIGRIDEFIFDGKWD